MPDKKHLVNRGSMVTTTAPSSLLMVNGRLQGLFGLILLFFRHDLFMVVFGYGSGLINFNGGIRNRCDFTVTCG